MQIVTSPTKKLMYKFFFSLVFSKQHSSWTLVAFWWWWRFKHWPESQWRHCITHCITRSRVRFCLLSENMHSKSYIKTTFEINPTSLIRCCWGRYIWSLKFWRGGRCSDHPWQTMFNSLYERHSDGHVWNHLWVKGALVKLFHLLLYHLK